MSWGFPCNDPSVGQQECGAERAPVLAEKRTPGLAATAGGHAAPRAMTGLARVLRFVALIVLALVCAHVGGGAASRSPAASTRAGQSANARFVSRKIALSPHARHRVNAPARPDVGPDAHAGDGADHRPQGRSPSTTTDGTRARRGSRSWSTVPPTSTPGDGTRSSRSRPTSSRATPRGSPSHAPFLAARLPSDSDASSPLP
jgi:hypothetical protein